MQTLSAGLLVFTLLIGVSQSEDVFHKTPILAESVNLENSVSRPLTLADTDYEDNETIDIAKRSVSASDAEDKVFGSLGYKTQSHSNSYKRPHKYNSYNHEYETTTQSILETIVRFIVPLPKKPNHYGYYGPSNSTDASDDFDDSNTSKYGKPISLIVTFLLMCLIAYAYYAAYRADMTGHRSLVSNFQENIEDLAGQVYSAIDTMAKK